MKKKIIFVMETLRIGGAEKSLVTILSMLDKEKYDIYLYLFQQTGAFLEQVPESVTILPIPKADALSKNFKTDWLIYLVNGYCKQSYHSFKWLMNCFISRFLKKESEYIGWNESKHLFSPIPGHFDVAIGFMEKKATYFVVDHVQAAKKIAFMHTDYDAIPHDEKLDKEYYRKLNYLAVVSEHTGETMLQHFPFLDGKIKVIKNMVAPEVIRAMAESPAPEMKACEAAIKVTTVGRLTPPKKIDGAVRILKLLRDSGMDVEWFAVGDGEERTNLEKQIMEARLQGKFHLVGAKSNPYPYMKNCDIYVQPSRWEGYGITVAEAKVLCKPIVGSDIPEFREQLIDGVTGIIAESEEQFVQAIQELLNQPEKKQVLIENLKEEMPNQQELQKLCRMLDGKNGE